jgi:hypothetical protein
MPADGLSLVGFMDQNQAVTYLRDHTIPADNSDAALISEWNQAFANLGAPVMNAGKPDIRDLSAAETASLMAHPYLVNALASFPGSKFALVEIDPLLAYQFSIYLTRSTHHCSHLGSQPSFDELARFCLPSAPVHDTIQQFLQPQSALIKSRSLNIQMGTRGIFTNQNGPTAMGFEIQLSLPLAHVVRLNGRCYLHNGFHRAFGIRQAGVTHIPCIFRDVPDPNAAAINPPSTFPIALLESANPPTLAHLTRGSAWRVRLKNTSRILHISWAEYVAFDE